MSIESPVTVETPTFPSIARNQWLEYRSVWRWHFYAGLFCVPFVVVLAISGSIYLFKPQFEAWADRKFDTLVLEGTAATAAEQVRAAVASAPGSTLAGYEIPTSSNSAARVLVKRGGETVRVYVHPQSLGVLKTVREQDRFMRLVFRVHGQLMIGNVGSYVVELAASWTIVMILTGLYLWWPRSGAGMGGVVYPRLGRGTRLFWRDVHAVTGVWVSTFALLLLLSGLPWAKFWGDYLKKSRELTGTAVTRQDWSNGATPPPHGEHASHGAGRARRAAAVGQSADFSAVDRIVATVVPLGLEPPVVIAPPREGPDWTAKSLTADRPRRVDLTLSEDGAIRKRTDFKDRHPIDRIVGTGIAYHEGQLFGWPNQLLGLLTASGLLLLCASSVVMWWSRRSVGVLGAPKGTAAMPRSPWGLVVAVVLLALFLPLFGASLLIVRLLELGVLRQIPVLRDWLGLAPLAGER